MGENANVQLSYTNGSSGIGVISCCRSELAFGTMGEGREGFYVFLLTSGSPLEIFYWS